VSESEPSLEQILTQVVNCNNPGTWAFHCHILPRAESAHGMFGMVTALVVQK